MLAAYSPEAKIESALRNLNCAANNLIKIAKVSGINVNTFMMSEALNGKKPLSRDTSERILVLLGEMAKLQASLPVLVDWSGIEKVSTALTIRRIASIAAERGDDSFDSFAAVATKNVAK